MIGTWIDRRRARTRDAARDLHARTFGARRRRTAGEAQAVDFADDGVAGDAAQLTRDLAGAQAIGPELLQLLDAFFRPTHVVVPPRWTGVWLRRPIVWEAWRTTR